MWYVICDIDGHKSYKTLSGGGGDQSHKWHW